MAMVNVVTVAAYRRIYWLRLISLVQRSAATWRCVLHSSDEPGELSQWQCHDDSTINNVVTITITITISTERLCADLISSHWARQNVSQILTRLLTTHHVDYHLLCTARTDIHRHTQVCFCTNVRIWTVRTSMCGYPKDV